MPLTIVLPNVASEFIEMIQEVDAVIKKSKYVFWELSLDYADDLRRLRLLLQVYLVEGGVEGCGPMELPKETGMVGFASFIRPTTQHILDQGGGIACQSDGRLSGL